MKGREGERNTREEVEKEKGHEKIWSPLLHKAGEEGNGGMRSPSPSFEVGSGGGGRKEKRCKAGEIMMRKKEKSAIPAACMGNTCARRWRW